MFRTLILIASIAWAFPTTLFADELATNVESFVKLVHERTDFRGAVLVGKHGEIAWSGGFGTTSPTESTKIDERSLFEIASSTKSLTALAVGRLHEDGKLDLDDSIAKYFDVPANCHKITLRHLLNHTSGIPGSNVEGHPSDFRLALEKFLRGGPRTEPGTRYQYWNQGYSILSEVIAKVSGRSYTDYVREAIFKPASMSASCFNGDPCPAEFSAVVGTARGRAPRSALDHPYGSYGYQYRGMGGAVTNLRDLWHLDRALATEKILSKRTFDEMISAPVAKAGLGWNVTVAPDGSKSHGHSGSVRGFLANVTRYPSVDGCIFILECDQNSTAFSILQSGLEQILFDKPAPFVPATFTEDEHRRLLGKFVDDRKRELLVTSNMAANSSQQGFPRLQIDWGSISTFGILGKDPNQQVKLYLAGKDGLKEDCVIDFEPADATAQTATLRLQTGKSLVFRRAND